MVYFVIEKTMGKVFTAGKNLDDLSKEIQDFQSKNIYSVADLSIEGIEKGPKEVIQILTNLLFNSTWIVMPNKQ